MPDRIKNKPRLLPGLEFVYLAWLDLTTCRVSHDSQIPWTAIDRYAERNGVAEDEFEWFLALIRRMDASYFRFRDYQKQINAPARKGKPPIRSSLRRPRKHR